MSIFDWSKEAEKQWDDQSSSWNSKSREMWESGSRKEIVPFFSKYVDSGARICDLGCGDGFGSFQLERAGYKVTGLDVSEEMLQKAQEINKGNNTEFVKGDISVLPFPDRAFDAVLAINSLEWTEHPFMVLREAQRVVKPGGFACVGILGPTAAPRNNSFRRLYGEKVICNTMMPWEFEKLAADNNWEKIGDLGVYKRSADQLPKGTLSTELKQSLSFMWVFMLQNKIEVLEKLNQ
ncbi:class I SAM-dependent methyltransferase [Cytobacillus depressus]|uniref:Class I SAM-dependent methyltransferase n=1 Tax=Cytobacillus depressus TaxID=1602942 RepID=A0A6L3V964_9BACI|nr:class I SAM-dependent methyltransferase [Cytobacillus depressus]KAB2338211.1 class I SAM-dependent methyltransferase [Cytobacillus depressus]